MSRIEYRRGTSPEALADLPDGCAAAIVTDPPYGLGAGYGLRREQTAGGGDAGQWVIANDGDLSALSQAAVEMHRVLAPFSPAIVFAAPTESAAAVDLLASAGFHTWARIIWDKGNAGLSYKVRWAHEDIIVATRSAVEPPWDDRDPLWSVQRAARVQVPSHPNEKPVALLRLLIAWACPNGGLVVDPFAGIASCGVAAIAQGCDYIGVECDERWWPIAERRLADARHLPHPDLAQLDLMGGAA